MRISAFITLVGLLITNFGFGQKRQLEYSGFFDSYYFRGPLAYTIGVSANGYLGDICNLPECNTPKFGLNLGVNYKVWPRTAFGAEFSYFSLQAFDQNIRRNIAFTSTNYELDLFGRFFLIEDIVRIAADRSRKPKFVKPYVHLGFGGLYYDPVSTYNGPTDTAYARAENRGYPGITLAIPMGLGFSFAFSHRVNLLLEFTYKLTLSDYLDDVGEVRGNNKGLKDGVALVNLKLQIAPTAPKVKRKKKYNGQSPQNGGGGGTTAPADGGATPAETPASPQAPAPETPAPDQAQPEQPAPETPSPEQPQGEQPAQEGQEAPQQDAPKPEN